VKWKPEVGGEGKIFFLCWWWLPGVCDQFLFVLTVLPINSSPFFIHDTTFILSWFERVYTSFELHRHIY
jgi:hypothetical protein